MHDKVAGKSLAVIVKNLTSGGAEKQAVLLAKALNSDYDVYFVILNKANIHGKYIKMLEADNVRVVAFDGILASRFLKLVKFLSARHIDCVFSYLTAANFFACIAGRITGVKIFTGIRNAHLPFMKMMIDKTIGNWMTEKVISNSYSGKDYMEAHGAKNVIVIPNCFENISEYTSKPTKEKVEIITVGRFVAQKDYDTALRTISLLKEKNNDFIFTIVGYGKLEEEIRNKVSELKLEDVVRIYINPNIIPNLENNADIYLSTSLFEGTSNSIMEGMNANLPIVATNVGDNDRLVKNGENGYLCKIKDAFNLCEALLKLIGNPSLRENMGKRSKEILREEYSVAEFKRKYVELINERTNMNIKQVLNGGGSKSLTPVISLVVVPDYRTAA